MDIKYWDRHKVVCIVTAIALLIFLASSNVITSMDETAFEYAGDRLSTDQADAVIRFYDLYDQKLPTSYDTLDSLTTVAWYIALLGGLYSAWTALDIPKRYQKKEKK